MGETASGLEGYPAIMGGYWPQLTQSKYEIIWERWNDRPSECLPLAPCPHLVYPYFGRWIFPILVGYVTLFQFVARIPIFASQIQIKTISINLKTNLAYNAASPIRKQHLRLPVVFSTQRVLTKKSIRVCLTLWYSKSIGLSSSALVKPQ